MSPHERAADWLAQRVAGGDGGLRREVASTTRELCREDSRAQRWLELLSLVALALRLRSRARTGDRPDAVWRQGAQLAAVLLLSALATQSAAGGLADAPKLGLAVVLAAAAVCALRSRRGAAIALAGSGACLEAVWLGHGLQVGAFVSCCAVAIGGLLSAEGSVPYRRPGTVLLSASIGAALLAAPVIGSAAAEAASVLAFAWIAPIALLVAGWLDPRLAAAATAIVFARLAASGFGELGRALAVLRAAGQRDLLLRWLAMSSGVVGAWLVTNRSIRHTERL